MVSLEWTFEKDFAGAVRNQNVKLSREKIEQDHYLICQSQQNRSTPGAKITDIVLPNDGKEYCIEVDGFANNKKAFIWVIDQSRKRLIREYVTLPELVATSQKIEPTRATFKLNLSGAGAAAAAGDDFKEYIKVSIGVLFGGSTPNCNDIFFIKRIRLYDNSEKKGGARSKGGFTQTGVQITRVYQNVNQLELDLPNPKRDNQTGMKEGEYAIIKQNGGSHDHGKLFVVYSDSDLGDAMNLKYVCNITCQDNILTKSLFLTDDQVIPIYGNQWKAYQDVKNEETAKQFYDPAGKTNKIGGVSKKDGKVYLYFDRKGYIRWMNSRRLRPKREAEEEISISVSQPLVDRLKKLSNHIQSGKLSQTLKKSLNESLKENLKESLESLMSVNLAKVEEKKEKKDDKPIFKPLTESSKPEVDGTLSQEEENNPVSTQTTTTLAKNLGNLTKSTDMTLISDASATYRTKTRRYILGDYENMEL